jgi:hypothetical protein
MYYFDKAREEVNKDDELAGLRSNLGFSDLHVGLNIASNVILYQKKQIELLEKRISELEER